MDQDVGIAGPIGDQLAVERRRLIESAVLKRQVPRQLERVVPPRTAKRLVEHPPEQADVATAGALMEPTLGQSVRPVAVELSGLGR